MLGGMILRDNPLTTQYRFCCLVFGLTPSPAILNGGAHNIEEGFSVYQGATQLMKAGGFNPRKRSTNNKNLGQRISSGAASTPG